MKTSRFIRKTEQMRKSFFLFGLVLALGAAHSALSYRLVESFNIPSVGTSVSLTDDLVIPITVRREQPKPIKQKEIEKTIAKANTDVFIAVDDFTFIDEGDEEPLDDVLSIEEEADKEYFMASLDRKPIYSGCETLSSDEEKFSCFQEKLSMHVRDNFKTNKMGWGAREKLVVKFVIDKEGNIGEVKVARGEEADKEQLKRIIKTLPQFTPGMYKGKYVKTSYVLPVVIRN